MREFGFKPTWWSIVRSLALALFSGGLALAEVSDAVFRARAARPSTTHPMWVVIVACIGPILLVNVVRLLRRRWEGRQRVRLTATSLIAPVTARSRREQVVSLSAIRRVRMEESHFFPKCLVVTHAGDEIRLWATQLPDAADLVELERLLRERIPPPPSPARKWQFSLRDLFFIMTVFAFWLAFNQSMDDPRFAVPIRVTCMLLMAMGVTGYLMPATGVFLVGFFFGTCIESGLLHANVQSPPVSHGLSDWFSFAPPIQRLAQNLGLSAGAADFVDQAAEVLLAGAVGGAVAILLVRFTRQWWQKWLPAVGH